MKTTFGTNLAALGVAAAVGAGSLLLFEVSRRGAGTDNAYVEGDVTPISARIAGQVAQEFVADHQPVKAGDLLYRIDDQDYRARVAQARADVSGRAAALVALQEELQLQRAVIAQAEAAVRGASAGADRSRREHVRAVSLRAGGWVSEARTDQSWASNELARADLDRAGADLVAARQRIDVIESERARLTAALSAAEAALNLAEFDLRSTEVRAPADGIVGERKARVGQYVRPGAEMIALVSQRRWVTANLKETQLAGVAVGHRVQVVADAIPGAALEGVVESLSPASGAKFALLPPDNATGNFTRVVRRIPVRVALAPGQPALARLRPGMSARVRFVH